MKARRSIDAAAAVVVVSAFALTPQAGTTTTVSLVSQDTRAVRFALPSIEIRVDSPDGERARLVATALAEDVAARAHTRVPGKGEIATYALVVDLPAPEGGRQRFDAKLIDADGALMWSAAGTSHSDDGPVDGEALPGIARNVLSALVRDGWLHAKYDPNDPPPPPPALRR